MGMHKAGWLAPALVLAIAACDGGGTEPGPVQERPVTTVVVGGADQSAPVKTELPSAVSVAVRREDSSGSHTPLPNTLVSFVVPDAACGRPLAGAAMTDSNGVATARWELGTAARRCKMEVRALGRDSVAATTYDSVFATALPGPATQIGLMGAGTPSAPARTIAAGDSIAISAIVSTVSDAYGNLIERTGLEWRVDAGCDLSGCTQAGVRSATGYARFPGAGTFRLYVLKDAAVNFMWVKVQ